MSHTYSRVLVHVVFSTKNHIQLLQAKDLRKRLHSYFAGIIKDQFGYALAVDGVADHVHMLVDLDMTVAIADMINKVKTRTSKWLNRNFQLPVRFSWQIGYGAFSVSESLSAKAVTYIKNQERHHSKMSFQDEIIHLLKKHGFEIHDKIFD